MNEQLAITGRSLKCVDLRLEWFLFSDNQSLDAPAFTPSGSHLKVPTSLDGVNVVIPRHYMWEN
jgi:hypothetical protein